MSQRAIARAVVGCMVFMSGIILNTIILVNILIILHQFELGSGVKLLGAAFIYYIFFGGSVVVKEIRIKLKTPSVEKWL